MGALYFVVWITASGVQAQGVTDGWLGHGGSEQATIERACGTLQALKKREAGAKLYRIEKSSMCGCDWGCECPVMVEAVSCVQETIPAVPARPIIRVVPE